MSEIKEIVSDRYNNVMCTNKDNTNKINKYQAISNNKEQMPNCSIVNNTNNNKIITKVKVICKGGRRRISTGSNKGTVVICSGAQRRIRI